MVDFHAFLHVKGSLTHFASTPDEISIKFHQDFGFSQVGENDFIDHSVAYFQK